MKLNCLQPTAEFPVQLHKQRICSICRKRRSYNARIMTTLDQHICSRRPCAKVKALLANTHSSGTLAVEVHYFYHNHIANNCIQPYISVSELHGHASLASHAELPGDFDYPQEQDRLTEMRDKPPYIAKAKKPWQTL
jgi:hypothetical protein